MANAKRPCHIRPLLDLLEDRTVPSTATPIESGAHYYYSDNQEVTLLERSGEYVLGISPGADVQDLLATGPLAGMSVQRQIDANVYMLQGQLASGPNQFGVEWMSPLFEGVESGRWLTPTNEVIVALKSGESAESFFAGDRRFSGFRPLVGTPDQFLGTVAAGSGLAVIDLANELQTDSRLHWAEPNLYQDWQKFFTPNDPVYPSQWHLNNTGQNGSTPNADVDAPEAWNVSPGGSANIVIAIVDDGIEYTHPDLAANIFTNPGEIAGNGIDDDANGWVDDIRGWDFTSNDADPGPSTTADEHGTSTSGIAAAVGDNGLGVVGIAYNSRILPARIFAGASATTDANIASALYYSAGRTANGAGTWNAASIVSNSWGGGASSSVINSALTWATNSGRGGKGVLNLIASGNGGGASVSQPAVQAATNAGVFAIGASTDLNVRATYSQYGTGLDFLAPSSGAGYGGNYGTVTTDRTSANGYNTASGTNGNYTNTAGSAFGGTSSATPLAAGIAALVLAIDPNLTAAQVRGLMRNTTDYINPGTASYAAATGYSTRYGYGKTNAFTALSGIGVAEIQVLNGGSNIANGGTVSFTAAVGSSQTLTLRVRNQGTQTLTLGSINLGAGDFSLVTGFGNLSLAVGQSTTFEIKFAPTSFGTVTDTLVFANNDTNEGSFSITLNGGPVGSNSFGYSYASAMFDPALNIQPGANGVNSLSSLASVDDAAQVLSLGANRFNYYENSYSQLYVSSNGLLSFGSSNSEYENTDLSISPTSPVLAVLWDDLRTNRNTTTNDLVLYQFQDLDGDSTADQLVVNWRNVHYFNGPNTDNGIAFQAVLLLNTGSNTGAIIFNYVDLDDGSGVGGAQGSNFGASSTVGIKNAGTTPSASDVVLFMNGGSSTYVGAGKAIRIYKNSPPTANANGPYSVTAGNTVQLSSAGSTDPDLPNDTLTYLWDLDADGLFGETGGSALRGSETGPTPTFNAVGLIAGAYPVSLRVYDSTGAFGTAAGIVNVASNAPNVSTVSIGDGTNQRSTIRRIVVAFDQIIAYAADPLAAFTLSTQAGGTVSLGVSTATVGNHTEVTLTFLSETTFGSLIDGRYTLVVNASQVLGVGGTPMAVNTSRDFHRYFGDWNGDARLDIVDFGPFSSTFLMQQGQAGFLSEFDYNFDGRSDVQDFGQFSIRYFSLLP